DPKIDWLTIFHVLHFGAWIAQGAEDHTTVHTDQDAMSKHRFLEKWGQRVGKGLERGLEVEVDERLNQRFNLLAGYVGHAVREDKLDTRAGGLVRIVGHDGHGVVGVHANG